MFGFEEYYDGLILEAKSPEEIKKILEYQFVQGKGVPQNVLDAVFEIDPTKKKSYTRWVLMQWEQFGNDIATALKDGSLKRMFDYFKKRSHTEAGGAGLDLSAMKDFKQAMEMLPDIDPVLEKEGDPNAPENQYDVVYNTAEWTIAVPKTYEADKKLGKGCKWCTAGAFGDSDNWWRRYSPVGPLWVNFDRRGKEICPMDNKEYPYKRYQFLFEWEGWNGEFMDCRDHRISFDEIDLPEEVKEFYTQQNERYGEIIENGSDETHAQRLEEYNEDRFNYAHVVLETNINGYDKLLYLMPEENEDMNLDVPYMLYDDEDTSDSPFSYHFNEADYMVANFSNDGFAGAILRNDRDNLVFVYWKSERYYGGWESYDGVNFITCEPFYLVAPYREVPMVFEGNTITDHYSSGPYELQELYEMDVEISDMFINTNIDRFTNQNQVYGYSGNWIELIYDDGYHGLLWIGDDFELVVRKDKPANGSAFEPFLNDDGVLCVKGQTLTYRLDDSEENGWIADEVGNDEDYIVQYGDGKKNVWNSKARKMIFDTQLDDISVFYTERMAIAVVETDEVIGNIGSNTLKRKFFYNFDTHQKEWEDFIAISKVNTYGRSSNFFVCDVNKDESYLVSIDGEHVQTLGRCISARPLTTTKNYLVVEREPGAWNLFNIETKKDVLPFYFKKYHFLEHTSIALLQLPDSDEIIAYDFATNKTVVENVGLVAPECHIYGDGKHFLWSCTDAQTKKKMLFLNDNKVINVGFDKILKTYRRDSEFYYCLALADNVYYILKISEDGQVDILPSRQGIPATIGEFERTGSFGFRFYIMRHPDNGGYYSVNYFPETGKVEIFGPYHSVVPEKPEEKEQIEKFFSPAMAQVQENFRKIYKSILDADINKR